jgi:hypothetical protein
MDAHSCNGEVRNEGMTLGTLTRSFIALIVGCWLTGAVSAEPWAGPGDARLRNDLQLLNDTGVINIPLTAWPVAWGDVYNSLTNASIGGLSPDARAAYDRVRRLARDEMSDGYAVIEFAASGADNPRIVRSFEHTPREETEVMAGVSWVGEWFAFNLRATYADNPLDGDEYRPDGTYVGVALGNWMLSAGWQDRWWGPGRDGSMILSTNARPLPSVGIQRISSVPSASKWFRWMGPWTLTSFMGQMDDERVVKDGWLFGLRGSFRPLRGLEIGLSRTAQLCGEGRKCDLEAFLNMLRGKDNAGANVNPDEEPGNQLGGFDIRWTLPRQIPMAIYMQWTAEDTRDTGASLHQWLRQVGVEFWGGIGDASHRTHFEVGDTLARRGGIGENSAVPNSAYNHGIFETGYRYNGRSLGHPMDGDGLSFSLGTTVVQSSGHTWNLSLRHMEINREGSPDSRHTLSATPQELTDIQISYDRLTAFGRIYAGVGYSRLDDELSGLTSSEASGFLRWSLH